MVLLLKWIIFPNVLFLRKLFHVSVFMALEGENSRAAEPNSCSRVLPFGEQSLGLTWKTSREKARQALVLKSSVFGCRLGGELRCE